MLHVNRCMHYCVHLCVISCVGSEMNEVIIVCTIFNSICGLLQFAGQGHPLTTLPLDSFQTDQLHVGQL